MKSGSARSAPPTSTARRAGAGRRRRAAARRARASRRSPGASSGVTTISARVPVARDDRARATVGDAGQLLRPPRGTRRPPAGRPAPSPKSATTWTGPQRARAGRPCAASSKPDARLEVLRELRDRAVAALQRERRDRDQQHQRGRADREQQRAAHQRGRPALPERSRSRAVRAGGASAPVALTTRPGSSARRPSTAISAGSSVTAPRTAIADDDDRADRHRAHRPSSRSGTARRARRSRSRRRRRRRSPEVRIATSTRLVAVDARRAAPRGSATRMNSE